MTVVSEQGHAGERVDALLVEDNPVDVRLVGQFLGETVGDGRSAASTSTRYLFDSVNHCVPSWADTE